MQFDRASNLSFIIKTSGHVLASMPDEEEFSPRHIRDYVAGPPEVLCETRDGYLLFHNREGKAKGLPLNFLATSVYSKYSRQPGEVSGRVFLAHPDHVPAYWRRSMRLS